MKLKNITLVLAASCALACGASLNGIQVAVALPALPAYDLWIDPAADAATRSAVAEAVSQWQTYTDVVIRVHEGAQSCATAGCFVVTENNLKGLDAITDTTWGGWTSPGVIYIAPETSYDIAQHSVTHEIGHALGLVHHAPPYIAVMAPTYGTAADHVACDDVRQFYSVRSGVIPKTVKPCTDAPGALPWDGGAE